MRSMAIVVCLLILGLCTACGDEVFHVVAAPAEPPEPPEPPPAGPTITVNGTVIAGETVPRPGVAVMILGHAPVVSDANGQFVFEDVEVPYTAVVVRDDADRANIYVGLTRADPFLQTSGNSGPIYEATVAGTVSGGAGFPEPVNHRTTIYPHVAQRAQGVIGPPNPATGDYSFFSINWPVNPQSELTMRALQGEFDAVTQFPVNYTGYAELTTPVAGDDMLVGQNLVLQPIATAALTGTVTTPAGFPLLSVSLRADMSDDEDLQLFAGLDASTPFSINAPEIPGGTMRLTMRADDAAGFGYILTAERANLAPGTGGLTFDLELPDDCILPPDGAQFVGHDTLFLTTEMAGRVRVMNLFAGGGTPSFSIHTTEASFTIPDLSALGLTLPPLTMYGWSVFSYGPFASIDDVAGPSGLFVRLDSSVSSFSPSRTFTTAP